MDSPYPTYLRSRYDQADSMGIDSKIVIMGNSGVGKTSLLQRYTQNKFDPKNTTSTSGAFFVTKKVFVNNIKVRLQLWDTAGQERFRSMAPMYYRGANAALLLYDITNASTFNDVRGWLEELKKNCSPDLIIYIVGSKVDLQPYRQVTADFARLSLHNWFPPPQPPAPPPPPPQPSTLSYIRPRFTSFPGLRSSPPSSSSSSSNSGPSTTEAPSYIDLPSDRATLSRSKTSAGAPPTVRPRASTLTRATTVTAVPQSRFGSHFGLAAGRYDSHSDSCSESIEEEEEAGAETEWGLQKGMELFEISAKDDTGIASLFDHLLTAIIHKKDQIEEENLARKRDSVFLAPVPAWAGQADEEEAREQAARNSKGWSCC
ncbi:ras-domain-containing protein [Cylindrobasidium torrendii FP15055 ss-10]|uniref:Ras-domain-containing protein n=1 Tax=Cylindrobasidium torrendii FP15055 ss-10 TaxID=1314674 RepID=A0A0D7BTR2_9AGAR|nr:ras-domain-containing protein [Cylindrobasidium torrendii FP15055 ss-10]